MSDDLLHDDLARLAQRAEFGAGAIAPAEAIVGRAKRRRRNLRLCEGALALVVVAAATTGIVLSRPANHQNVAVSGTGASHHVALTEPALRAVGSTHASSGNVRLGAATMRTERSSTGITTCTVVNDAATSAADAGRRGPLRAGATGVSAIWLPNHPTNGVCRSTVTTAPASTADGLVKTIGQLSQAMDSCPVTTIVPGRVELVFSYATGKPWSVVSVTLGSCSGATLPGGQMRSATSLKLAGLDEPAWATSGLQFKSSSVTTGHAGHQKLKAGG